MKTAIEWLVNELKNNHGIDLKLYNEFNKAKEMEKEQMKLACIRTEYEDKAWQNLMEKHFEQYYNETFKSKQNETSTNNPRNSKDAYSFRCNGLYD